MNKASPRERKGRWVLQEGDKALCSWEQPNATAGHSRVVPATATGMGRKCVTTHSQLLFVCSGVWYR